MVEDFEFADLLEVRELAIHRFDRPPDNGRRRVREFAGNGDERGADQEHMMCASR